MVTGLVVGDRTQFELCSPKVAGHVFKFRMENHFQEYSMGQEIPYGMTSILLQSWFMNLNSALIERRDHEDRSVI